MQLTREQQNVLDTNQNLVINAVAGSGKTTTLLAFANSRPPDSRILYLAFNKTVKTEAIKKFSDAGLGNVKVETAHSLAYDHIVRRGNYKVVPGYKSYEWCELLNIRSGDRHSDLVVANHVSKFISYFCNSKAARVQDLDYPSILSDPQAAAFAKNFQSIIERCTREALAKMDKADMAVTHDFYLKKFQLSQPTLSYDYILFDEGQDASAAMLDVFLNQPAVKIIVGDMHQQIYGWRYAINSLQQVDFPVFNLSNSFRFDEEIALVANKILAWKKHLDQSSAVKIKGVGDPSGVPATKAVLGRTNLGLLINAIERWQQGQISKLYFEGNINSYTFADEGASLYDVLNLYNGKRALIRDRLIAEMKTMKELEEYIEKTEDTSLAMIVEAVKKFGNDLPGLIADLKAHHTTTKEEAEMIFSTVHRCKGMEYDEVTLLDDFISEEKLKKYIEQAGGDKIKDAEKNRLGEEINILYVAATRAKSKLIIPADINPLRSIGLAPSSQNIILPTNRYDIHRTRDRWDFYDNFYEENRLANNYSRRTNHGKHWTEDDVDSLENLFKKGISIKDIAKKLGRGQRGVRFKLMEMGLMEGEDIDE